MGDAVKPLASLDGFKQLMLDMSSNPILAVIVGAGLTALVQSSSATIGILQEFYGRILISLNAAIPVLLGDNIGTTITAILASLAGSIAAKRAALVHVIFNLIGVIIFTIFLPVVIHLIKLLRCMALKTSDDDCSITWYLQHNKYFDSITICSRFSMDSYKACPR